MATKTLVRMVDDIDGSEAAETVAFAFDNAQYEIDLSKQNAANFRKAVGEDIDHARRVGGRAKRGTGKRANHDVHEVREWAQNNGHNVSSRGRIPARVLQAYQEAQV